MTSVNVPVVVIIFLLCFHLGLTKFYLRGNQDFVKSARTVHTADSPIQDYDTNLSDPENENTFSQLINDCGSLDGCFGENKDESNTLDDKDVKRLRPDGNNDQELQQIIKSGRTKRYPEHLDPNQLPFYPFWIRVGECPLSSDGARQHYCPTPTSAGKWVCIDDYQLCDGMKNCPNAEDESSHYCLFYKVLKAEVELLTRTISSLGSTNTVEDVHQSEEMMRPKTSRLSWTVAK